MFLDIVGVITTSKLNILSTFQGGAPGAPPMSSRVNKCPVLVCPGGWLKQMSKHGGN